jgi:hypothetical protein
MSSGKASGLSPGAQGNAMLYSPDSCNVGDTLSERYDSFARNRSNTPSSPQVNGPVGAAQPLQYSPRWLGIPYDASGKASGLSPGAQGNAMLYSPDSCNVGDTLSASSEWSCGSCAAIAV